jgi:hypothetical protein
MPPAPLPFRTPVTAEFIHGAVETEATPDGLIVHRLPAWARAQWADPQLAMAEWQPSGVRLLFETAATVLELLVLPTKRAYAGMAPRPDGVYELFVDGVLAQHASARGGNTLAIDMVRGTSAVIAGEPQTLRFGALAAGLKRIEIWLPHDEATALHALHADALLAPIAAIGGTGLPRWLHHGSSISQGSNAVRPSGIWPAVAARQAGFDLTNLGFSGSALLDPFVARSMRDLPADRISVKLGINLVNTDLMRVRAFGPAVHGFLDTIRDGHPHTPLLVISPLYCPIHESTPGPTLFDTTALADGQVQFRAAGSAQDSRQGKLTLQIVRTQLQAIVEQRAKTDPAIDYLDGLALYGAADHARMPLPDALHPDAASHRLIGERFGAWLMARR